MKQILVRFDDICPSMDYVQFHIAIEEMDKRGIKPLIGIIPDCMDPSLEIEKPHEDFWNFVKDLQERGYTIAMHGYKHVFDSHSRGNVVVRYDSEFAGLSFEKQFEKIRKGKEILEVHGLNTDIFFAPGHSYDDNTLKALAACGFKYMSDGKSLKPYMKYGIKCIPCRSAGVPRMRFGKYHTAVFHAHEWAWECKKYDYRNFMNLVENRYSEIVDFKTYSSQDCGNGFVQKIDESMYVTFERYIKPVLSKIRKLL